MVTNTIHLVVRPELHAFKYAFKYMPPDGVLQKGSQFPRSKQITFQIPSKVDIRSD